MWASRLSRTFRPSWTFRHCPLHVSLSVFHYDRPGGQQALWAREKENRCARPQGICVGVVGGETSASISLVDRGSATCEYGQAKRIYCKYRQALLSKTALRFAALFCSFLLALITTKGGWCVSTASSRLTVKRLSILFSSGTAIVSYQQPSHCHRHLYKSPLCA